jgi:hypothetical protein
VSPSRIPKSRLNRPECGWLLVRVIFTLGSDLNKNQIFISFFPKSGFTILANIDRLNLEELGPKIMSAYRYYNNGGFKIKSL